MTVGIVLNLTHTGAKPGQVILTDIWGDEIPGHRPGPFYLNPGDTIELVYTSIVATSYKNGNIRGFITGGYLTSTFTLDPDILTAIGITALEARVAALEDGAIDVYQGGALVQANVRDLNFASGATVVSGGAHAADVTIAGGGGGIDVLQGGVPILAGASAMNFAAGATVIDGGGGQANVTVTGGGSDEEFTAVCPAGAVVGQAVYLTGAAGPTVGLSQGLYASGTYATVGFIKSKSAPTVCVVLTDGELGGFAGLTPAAPYYLSASTPGVITAAWPVNPGEVYKKVGVAKDSTTLLINLDEDFTVL